MATGADETLVKEYRYDLLAMAAYGHILLAIFPAT
jgi:hypothetical protein